MYIIYHIYIYTDDIVDKHPNKRQISFDEVQKFARDKGCLCMEGSALSGKNVSEMFEGVIRKYVEKNGDLGGGGGGSSGNSSSDKSTNNSVKLDQQKGDTPKKKLCC